MNNFRVWMYRRQAATRRKDTRRVLTHAREASGCRRVQVSYPMIPGIVIENQTLSLRCGRLDITVACPPELDSRPAAPKGLTTRHADNFSTLPPRQYGRDWSTVKCLTSKKSAKGPNTRLRARWQRGSFGLTPPAEAPALRRDPRLPLLGGPPGAATQRAAKAAAQSAARTQ